MCQIGDPPDVQYRDGGEGSREERYANAFGRAFLTPARTVMQRFREVTQGASQLTRRHVIVLAYTFGVSREALVRRIEELNLTKPGYLGLVSGERRHHQRTGSTGPWRS